MKVKKNQQGIRTLKIDIEKFVMKVANDMKADAQKYCPVDTGKLQKSISIIKDDNKSDTDEIVYNIGTDVDYAKFVEFGTKFQEEQPYLRPASKNLKKFIRKNRKI